MTSADALVTSVEELLEPLARTRALAWWDSQVDASDENERKRAEAELAWSDALADSGLFLSVERVLGTVADGSIRRRLELARNLMVVHQLPAGLRARIVELESSVETRFSRHRGVVRGVEVDDNEIKRILRESDDPAERREAWEASKTVGAAVADDVRELARLRNRAAHALGHRDWFALALSTDELAEEKLVETLAEADRVTAEPFARWKAELDAQRPNLVLEERTQRLDKHELKIVRKSSHVVVGLDVGGAAAAAGLHHVGVEGALDEKIYVLFTVDLSGGGLEDPDELAPDDLPLLFGVGDAAKCGEEAHGRVDHVQPYPGRRHEVLLDLLRLAGP